jgi:hypothetical protein
MWTAGQAGQGPSVGFTIPPDPNPYKSEPFGRDAEYEAFEFSDATIRRAFIRKVYSILMCQLLITVGFISLFLFNDG